MVKFPSDRMANLTVPNEDVAKKQRELARREHEEEIKVNAETKERAEVINGSSTEKGRFVRTHA